MNAVTQAILNYSKLEVTLIRITEPTKDDFMMEIESRVTDTGPVGATMAPLTVDLIGPGGAFGKLTLPEVKTKSSGTDVNIPAQKIAITDYEAFKAFVKAIIQEEELTLKLDNGAGTIKALMMTSNIVYKKEVKLAGMNGPKARITGASGSKDNATINLQVFNPSPLEINLGNATYDLIAADGTKIGTAKGNQNIVRGDNQTELTVNFTGTAAVGAAKLIGTGAEADNWTRDTNQFLEMKVQVSEAVAAL